MTSGLCLYVCVCGGRGVYSRVSIEHYVPIHRSLRDHGLGIHDSVIHSN